MLTVFLALLCAGPVPTRLGAVQTQARAISGPVGLNSYWAGAQAPSVGLASAPSLFAARLSPAVLTPVPQIGAAAVALQPLAAAPQLAPGAPAAAAAPVLAGLEGWYSKTSEKSPPDAVSLAALWDGSQLKSAAAAADPVSPVPDFGGAPGLVKAAPETSGSVELSPGSVFDWKPVAQSPGHGLPLIDRLVRRLLGREGGHFQQGYEMTDVVRREDARVFFYGERHTDKGLIRENMRRIAADIRPGRGALVLDEGYFGPRLFGSEAIEYLEKKGLDPEWLGPAAAFGAGLELAGWDEKVAYDESKHPLLQHHMNLLDINGHLYSPERGLRYYTELARKALEAFRNWRVLRRLAIAERNLVLDRSVAAAIEQAQRTGQSLHVIAGAEHLVQRPLLAGVPFVGRPQMRRSLLRALGGRPYWAGKPADSALD